MYQDGFNHPSSLLFMVFNKKGLTLNIVHADDFTIDVAERWFKLLT